MRVAPGLFLRLARPDARELGELGEELAARHLRRRGWRLVARRLRTRDAEIDLLVFDGREHACVEVKSGRVGPWFRPGHRLDATRLERLRRAAAGLRPRTGGRVRVDLVEVLLDARGRTYAIELHRDLREPIAWGPAR